MIQKEPKTKFKKNQTPHIILDELRALRWWPLEK